MGCDEGEAARSNGAHLGKGELVVGVVDAFCTSLFFFKVAYV